MYAAARISILALMAAGIVAGPATAEEPKVKKQTECKSDAVISNADGRDGTNNNGGPDSGNGAKGGTIKNPCKAKGNVSANGGNGGNNNGGKKSGNGGAGGTIEF
jgi:hypothetical protein